jgi:hypothetical protein
MPLSFPTEYYLLGRLSKEYVQVRGSISFFVTNLFLTPDPNAGGPPLVVCLCLLIQYIRSLGLYYINLFRVSCDI